MDILYFLKERTRLIRQYYDLAVKPFETIVSKIEAEEEPYIPPYSEDGEPAFQNEWMEANEMIEITGRTCILMLSESLKLYFKTWEHDLYLKCGECFSNESGKKGFIAGYQACLTQKLGMDWSDCPADMDIIEQVVLARNRGQHHESITTIRVTHSDKDRERYSMPFFINDREAEFLQDENSSSWFMSPSIHISKEKLSMAIEQVESLSVWLEEKMFDAKYPSRR